MGLSLTQIAVLLALLLLPRHERNALSVRLSSLTLSLVRLESPTYFFAGVIGAKAAPARGPTGAAQAGWHAARAAGIATSGLAWATRPLPKFEPVGTTGRPAEPRPKLQARTPDRDYLGILTGLPILGRRPFAPGPHGPAMTKGWSSCYDRGMMRPSTRRILGRPIDAFEGVVTGYLITIDGRIWSRLTTRGMRDKWEQRDRVSRPRRATAYVALKVPGRKQPRELSVARLMLKAAFGALPMYVDWTVRYVNGDKGDCARQPPLRPGEAAAPTAPGIGLGSALGAPAGGQGPLPLPRPRRPETRRRRAGAAAAGLQ